jgi:flagellar basal body-associated protein FliL
MKEKEKKEENLEKGKIEKKGNKKVIIITLIILAVCVVAVAVGDFIYNYAEKNKSTGTEWGDIYYNYLEEASMATDEIDKNNHGLIKKDSMENTTIQFINLDQQDEPELVMNYVADGEDYTNIYYLKEDNSVSWITYYSKQDMKLLYNIEKEEYIYYAHSVNEEGTEKYISLPERLEELKKVGLDHTSADVSYSFTKNNMPQTEEVKDGEVPTISKFEETFIEPEVEENNTISIDLNGDIKSLKNALTETVEEYNKSEDQIITEDVKTEVEEKKTELNNKKEEIKKAEEEAQKAAEEEAAKKAAEEAAKGLQAGNYTLKYGTYKGTEYIYDVENIQTAEVTITINQDGTYTLKSSNTSVVSNSSGTYKVEKSPYSGLGGTHILNLSAGNFYTIIANNTLQVPAGSGATYTYQGD